MLEDTLPSPSGETALPSSAASVSATSDAPPAPPEKRQPYHPDAGECHKCKKPPGIGRKLQRCKGCKLALYCDAACQTADWPVHKPLCRARGEARTEHFLGLTRPQQIEAVGRWARMHAWTLERIARATVHLEGGVDAFLARPQVVLLMLAATPRAEMDRLELASILRATGTALVPLDVLRAEAPHLGEQWDADAAARAAVEAQGAQTARYAGILPVVYEAEGAGCVFTYHALHRFRREEAPDARTRAALEDFVMFAQGMVNGGRVLEPLKPGDAIAFPLRPEGECKKGERQPLFRNWKSHPMGPAGQGFEWKTSLTPDALMRIYAALA